MAMVVVAGVVVGDLGMGVWLSSGRNSGSCVDGGEGGLWSGWVMVE